jgi:hypothetical protein
MVSDTGKTESKRRRKQAAGGQDRKKALEKKGTTPKFPIHPQGPKGAGKPPQSR